MPEGIQVAGVEKIGMLLCHRTILVPSKEQSFIIYKFAYERLCLPTTKGTQFLIHQKVKSFGATLSQKALFLSKVT